MSSFVDECNLNVRGGDGGAGAVSTRREAHVPKGGPDGGDGGDGGDIWLVADRNVASLLAFRDHPHRRAKSGVHGQGAKKHGASGTDLIIPVPEGTSVFDHDTGVLLADLVNKGDRWLAAAGGQGGKGNAKFLSNRRRAPSFAEQGEEGQERWLRLELKLMADVALVGFPNVGKSTLISRISAAKPKIADYPFTTLEPNLGVVRTDDDQEFVVADIPGLIEGASEGKGLGHQFLRHIERARVLALMIDLATDSAQASPAEQQRILLDELGRYRPELLTRPRVIIGSRADLADEDELAAVDEANQAVLAAIDSGAEVDVPVGNIDVTVSSVTGTGLSRVVGLMADAVRRVRVEEPEPEAFVVYRPITEGIRVDRGDDGSYEVVGRQAERAVALSDLTNLEALDYAHLRLRKLGVDKALARAGARQGDTVRIGRLTFEYDEDGI